MKRNVVFGLIAVIIIILGLSLYTQKQPQKDTETVLIGAILPITGYAAIDGESIQQGITMAQEDLKQKGITVDVEVYDDATDPKKTIGGIALMEGKGIESIIGFAWTSQASAAAPVLKKNGMIGYAPAVTADVIDGSLTDKGSLFFGKPLISTIQAPSLAWMKENNVTRLMIVTANLTWGMVHAEAWKKAAEENGIEVVIHDSYVYENESSVLSQLLIRAKKEGVNGIVWTGGEAGAVTLVKKSQELGYTVPILGDYFLRDIVMNKKVDATGMNLSVIDSLSSKTFNEKYHAKYGTYPVTTNSLSTYNLVMIAVDAERNKGELSTREYVLQKTHDVYEGTYTFDSLGTPKNVLWEISKI